MAYATPTEFVALGLPAVALDGFSGDVQDHLDAASGIIDTYLRGRYKLPLAAPYSQEIIQITCSLAAYSILSLRGFNPEREPNIRLRYEDAMATLRSLADGTLSLALDADATPTVHDGRPVVRSSSRNTSALFRGVSTNALDDC